MRLIDADEFEKNIYKCVMYGNTAFVDKYEVLFRLKHTPTIDAEPIRHGKWIKENIVLTSLPPKSRWHCSRCGSINDGYDESVLTPYCFNCGAKMDADEISNIAKEAADGIAEALEKVKAKGWQKQNIEEDDKE